MGGAWMLRVGVGASLVVGCAHGGEVETRRLSRFESRAALGRYLEAMDPPPGIYGCGNPWGQRERLPTTEKAALQDGRKGRDAQGGFVKAHGDYLVVARLGHLISVGIDERSMRVIDVMPIDADTDLVSWRSPEMLVSDGVIALVDRGGGSKAHVRVFGIDRRGGFERGGEFTINGLRQAVARLKGRKLALFGTHELARGAAASLQLPHYEDGTEVVDAKNVRRPIVETGEPNLYLTATCDLGAEATACDAEGIVGPPASYVHEAADAVLVWAGSEEDPVLHRLPLLGGSLGAVRARGTPIDRFAFDESRGVVHVFVSAATDGLDDLKLLRMPTSSSRPRLRVVDVPDLLGHADTIRTRFVGRHLLYGHRSGTVVNVVPLDAPGKTATLDLSHQVDRIEAMRETAVAVADDGATLHFTPLMLGRSPQAGSGFVLSDPPDSFFHGLGSRDEGVVALPTRIRPGGTDAVRFFDPHREFAALGELTATRSVFVDERCSLDFCFNWQRNQQRPFFYDDRVFALLGHELVEGRLDNGQIREVGRIELDDHYNVRQFEIDFSPGPEERPAESPVTHTFQRFALAGLLLACAAPTTPPAPTAPRGPRPILAGEFVVLPARRVPLWRTDRHDAAAESRRGTEDRLRDGGRAIRRRPNRGHECRRGPSLRRAADGTDVGAPAVLRRPRRARDDPVGVARHILLRQGARPLQVRSAGEAPRGQVPRSARDDPVSATSSSRRGPTS